MIHPPVIGLTPEHCRERQERLVEQMARHNLDALLLAEAGHVNYCTGYWARTVFRRAVLLERDGRVTLAHPAGMAQPNVAADACVEAEISRCSTLVDDQLAAVVDALEPRVGELTRIGCDGGVHVGLLTSKKLVDAGPLLRHVRRRKLADERALLKRAAQATEAAFDWVRLTLGEGVDEVELFAGMQAAAIQHAGETLGEFGNDFQIGAVGSSPRRRPAQRGEIAIFDLSVVLRGYSSDMCRSFVVGGEPSASQRDAHQRIMDAMAYVEAHARPGASCRAIYKAVHAMLEGHRGWHFRHHLGHGIGLSAHESPRINPNYDDHLEPGDIISVEPGLYGEDLHAGLRIENIYDITDAGAEPLTTHPTHL